MISSVRRSWSILLQTVAGAFCSVFLFILLTDSAQALIDINLNGVSDLWEKTNNSGNLFTNFNSLADTDGDGWTNGTEAISGTNPLDQIAPQGIIPLQIIQTPAVYTTGPNGEPQIFTPAAISITWPTLTGKQYTLFTSVDLTPGSWLAIDNDTPRIGTTALMGNAFSISQPEGNSAPSMFYRLAINDADSDGDTLTNHEEATLATDPFSPDTDLDGFSDNTDPAPLSSATLTDPDGAGLVNAQNIPLSIANGLIGRWNLEDHQIISNPPTGYTPFQYPDSAGANPATSFSVFPHPEGMVSKATNHAGGYLSIPTAVLGTRKIYTTAFWALLEPGSISAANGAPVALFSHHQRIPWLINNVPQWGRYTEQLNGLWFEKSGSQERLRAGTHLYTNHLNGVPTAGTTTSLGINILRDAGTADDGKWHHYTFVHHDATKTLYIDGVLVGTATHTPATISINSIYSGISLGRISGPSPAATGYFQGTSPTRGRMDRLRIWNRPLTPAEATALYQEDIDKDDLWDITENNRLWRDNNSDGLQTTTERAFSSSPFTWQATTSDTDDDGLTDVQEQTQGTKIDNPDTDGDLLPDGWEVDYQLNPLIPNDPNNDTDQDALTLLNEYRYNTNPTLANTDGDSQNDSIEVNQGSNPNDNSDGGAPVPPDQQLSILLGIGDKSGSHSEDYVLNCYRLDPTTGQEIRIYTLRSGGYGLYKEETQTIFKKGETYTFQIDWQSSNLDYQSAAPGVSAEGPDYDYTFKVQPQGSNTGILIDAYDPKTKTIGNPILAEDASDVATTEAEFKQNYERKRVTLSPVRIVSRDKFLAGSFRIPEGLDGAEIEFTGPENLGRYGNLFGGTGTKVFENIEDILNPPPGSVSVQPASQKVWFVRDAQDFRKICFYTCPSSLGTVEVKIHLNGGGSSQPYVLNHTLTVASDFASIITYVDRWVKGTSFEGEWANTTWLAMSGGEAAGILAHETCSCLIPFFDIIQQIDGFTPMVMGMCDGVRMGFADDKAFATLLLNASSTSKNWLQAQAALEIYRWANDPALRARQLKEMLNDLCRNVVLPRLQPLGTAFTSWEGFRDLAWKSWQKANELNLLISTLPTVGLGLVVTAFTDWGNDFCSRMMSGAEKTKWDATSWVTTYLLDGITSNQRISYYTFGYTFGYLGEQAAVGYVTAGSFTISKICAKNGINLIGKLAPRTLASAAMRFHFLKQALTDLNLMDDGLRAAYNSMMASAAREPTTPLIKEIPASLMEERLASPLVDRATFNLHDFIKTATANGNIRKLIATPQGRAIFAKRTSQLMHLLGDQCDAVTMKNFLKVAEERVVVVHADGTVDEFFEGFFRAFEGNPGSLSNLDDPVYSIAGYSEGAKARLKFFLSEPDAGALWKLDDYAPGDPESWKRYITRGVLGELNIYKRIYKPQGFGHSPTAPGFDFTGSKWVQVKTCKSPGTTQNIVDMKVAIDDLIDKSPSTAPLKLHILKKPGTDSVALETALADYKALDTGTRGRVQIVIEAYNIGPE